MAWIAGGALGLVLAACGNGEPQGGGPGGNGAGSTVAGVSGLGGTGGAAAGTNATGVTGGSTGGAGAGAGGAAGQLGTGGAAMGGMGGGSPMGGNTGTGGMAGMSGGTGGTGEAGGGAGGGSGGGGSCERGETAAAEVVIMGESFYAIRPQYIQNRIQDNARAAGSLGASETYRNVAVSAQNMNYIATTEWAAATQGGASVKVVIMDGGGIDCLGGDAPRVRARSRLCSARWPPPECRMSSTRATRNRETRRDQTAR